ncbi:MAG: YdcF family protein [Chloroflexota bacterium]|nr:YdcF family protein [Chloroflexota bacterium]MDQ5865464.1 YdcF family protein [Chloroflexota bacterium]
MRDKRRRLPTPLRLLLLLLGILAVWLGGDLAYVVIGAETDYAARADVIIVLGCNPYAPRGGPSVCLSSRGQHAANLYHRGLAERIIATGGHIENGPTEASVMLRVLTAAGVPESAVVLEEQAHNTIQNIGYSKEIMQHNGWDTAILVTEPYHIKRATLVARDAGLHVYPSPAVESPLWRNPDQRNFRVLRDTASLVLYQLKVATGTRE